ncbi:hypothetical protein E1B28_012884 [Marasmius oreades]|uniref:Uncharacterized protein n=1 Tax=Marasmius oreades TaxID=181124 RepID=A0A9P7UR99_9AGAR|nr:uncharacterized protein E1B28_012884 [Marasmius oreades]KAG7088939.1 hypothetical protein E1B28_012884 [Marasmius oreades]
MPEASPSTPSAPSHESSSPNRGRGRGRGKSRGGLGKYLRARGRGRGLGRPAEFQKRLLLEGEGIADEEDDEGEKAERLRKFSRRQLGTNVDRYKEEAPELGSDGELVVEPEVDLSTFLAKQKISDVPGPSTRAYEEDDDDDDVDHSLDHITSGYRSNKFEVFDSRKGKLQEVSWDNELDELMREKESADAARDLKSRFRAKSDKLMAKPLISSTRDRKQGAFDRFRHFCPGERKLNCLLGTVVDAPPLPLPENTKPKSHEEEMEDFLDELLG